MSRVFVTGSADGLGRGAAEALLEQGHEVVVHARDTARAEALADLVERGAEVVVGDLADESQVRRLAEEATALRPDAVVHNAGIMRGPGVLPVNVVAPYLLTALVEGPRRLIYLSSDMHVGGSTDLSGLDFSGTRPTATYSTTKLLVTTLSAAVARLRPDVVSNAVDPGWVPTKMGGPSAPDDLVQGHRTQVWLATSDDPRARTSGGYWHHVQRQDPHPAVRDEAFQDALLRALREHTGVDLPAT